MPRFAFPNVATVIVVPENGEKRCPISFFDGIHALDIGRNGIDRVSLARQTARHLDELLRDLLFKLWPGSQKERS